MEEKVHFSVKAPYGSSISNQVLCEGKNDLVQFDWKITIFPYLGKFLPLNIASITSLFKFTILYGVLQHLENYKQTTTDYLVPVETVDIFGSPTSRHKVAPSGMVTGEENYNY